MFDYDKVINKLGKFDELSEKKQKKWLRVIFCEKDFREWFYGVGDSATDQPKTNVMVQRIMKAMARPRQLKALTALIKDSDHQEFDHTSCALAFLVAEEAIESIRSANQDKSEEYKSGSISNREAKDYKELSNKYSALISNLTEALKDKASGAVKDISRKSNLPRGLVFTTYFLVPGREYIPKYKISMYTNSILKEVYKWAGSNGLEDIDMIRWGNLFGPYFGTEMTTSAAVAVLLEGVGRINNYKDCDHFNDVRSVWNSLTVFALAELDNAPENVRRQMVELYIKRIDRISHNNHGQLPRLRVNLLSVPADFSNLAETVLKYEDRIMSITKDSLKPVADFKSKYVDKHLEKLRENPQNQIKDPMEILDSAEPGGDDDDDPIRKQKLPEGEPVDDNFLEDLMNQSSKKSESSSDPDLNDDWPVDLDRSKRRSRDDDDDDSLIKGMPDPKLRKLEKMFGEIGEEDDEDEDGFNADKIPLPPDDDDDD